MHINGSYRFAHCHRRRVSGVSIVEYALVLALVVLPVILAVNSPELRTAVQRVFIGTVNTEDTAGSLQLEAFGEH
jgi:Flp pilus assembly pilin Flp